MSSSEEDSYSMIFTSLRHPVRRKILRILSSGAQTFSDLQRQFKIESSHLTYHIDGLGNLLYKSEDGKYALSSLGEAAVSMMRNVEEPPTTSHFPFTHTRLNASEKKVHGRAVAIALGTICIVLAATLVGAFTYYMPMINNKNNTISNLQKQIASDNSTINSLSSNITNLQKKLNNFLNFSYIEEMIMINPSAWVNRTVMIEGYLSGPYDFGPLYYFPPWNFRLRSDGHEIGVFLNPRNVSASLWNQLANGSVHVWIYGVVKAGRMTGYMNGTVTYGAVVYIIEAEAVVPF